MREANEGLPGTLVAGETKIPGLTGSLETTRGSALKDHPPSCQGDLALLPLFPGYQAHWWVPPHSQPSWTHTVSEMSRKVEPSTPPQKMGEIGGDGGGEPSMVTGCRPVIGDPLPPALLPYMFVTAG